ncbi:MAG TPA: signal recognition particle protein [Candidatus Woesearchaeota archaeon]|nr:signal recognition particle protein [Candidatus Woesearchaeota archaeon]
MVLDRLSDSLKNTLKKITRASFVDEKLVNELVKDIQRAFLQGDVNVKLVFEITKKIKERALKEEPPSGVTKKEFLIRIVYDELVNFLGGRGAKIVVKGKPFKIMLVGLFGSGKTTSAAKLAGFYKKRGLKVALVQTDTWRPAAYEQLETLAKKVKVDFYGVRGEKDAVRIYRNFEDEYKKYDMIIIDTAGRDALSKELIEELNSIYGVVKPDENLLVISADIGQAAEKQAEKFHETCKVTGVFITKLEGTAKGGGALIACAVTGAPVKFIGVGEKIPDIEEFRPEGFVGRLLGMGDLQALLEKAEEAISREEAEDLGRKFLKGEFNLIDLYEQMRALKKMGPLKKVMEMVPGLSQLKLPKEALQVQEKKLEVWRYIMDSMTKEELEDPEIISSSRIERIAKGSGTSAQEVRGLLKQYRQSKKLVKLMKGAGSERGVQKALQRLQKGGNLKFRI